MTDNKPKESYVTEVEHALCDLLEAGNFDGAFKLVREKLVQSFKNGIAAARRRGAKESENA